MRKSEVSIIPSRKTSNTAEERLESLCQVMRDEVLVNLNHSPPRSFFVLQTGFTANASNLCIVGTSCDQSIERILADTGISVDHKKIFVKLGIDTNNVVDLVLDQYLLCFSWSRKLNVCKLGESNLECKNFLCFLFWNLCEATLPKQTSSW